MGKLILLTLVLFSITAIYNETNVSGKEHCCEPDNRPVAAIDS